jgi:hypothetical protein
MARNLKAQGRRVAQAARLLCVRGIAASFALVPQVSRIRVVPTPAVNIGIRVTAQSWNSQSISASTLVKNGRDFFAATDAMA